MPEIGDELREWIDAHNPEALLADGFEDAIIGVAERCSCPSLVVYDAETCGAILVKQGMTPEEAAEYFSFNTLGAWVGPNTPLFMWRRPDPFDPTEFAIAVCREKLALMMIRCSIATGHGDTFDDLLRELEAALSGR